MTVTYVNFYKQCQNALINVLKTGLGSGATGTGHLITPDEQISDDDTIIMLGHDYFFIVRPGSFPSTDLNDSISDFQWNIKGELYVRYIEYKTSWEKFADFRNALIHVTKNHPTLGGGLGVAKVSIEAEADPDYFSFSADPDAQPNFIIQTVNVVATQRVEFSGGEL